jgi:hypothetical protein
MLHALTDTDVPPPGSNRTRLAFYRNPPLVGMVPMFGEANDKLLILWRVDFESGAPCFRVVRPIGQWKWGSFQQTDLDFALPQTVDELSELRFEPTDEDLGLELPLEEENDDAGGFAG